MTTFHEDAVVVLLRRHTQCEESVKAADWLTGPASVWQLRHVTRESADWLGEVSVVWSSGTSVKT